jgi:RimJ/RimL family protein N-acetyltransferase
MGRYTILEPLQIKKHSIDLFKNFSKDKKGIDWIYMPQGPFKNEISLKKYLKNKNLTGNPFFYTIYSKRLKTFCGLASYLRIKPQVGTIEVGYITYAKNLQRTVEGTEAMYLMMKNVFDDLGYRRYEWKCDNLNSKSKKAALRLGFKYEGLFRQATIYKKRNRDTAWFSIIDKEWKRYKKSYKLYLKRSNFNTKFIQKEKLKLT